MSWLGRSLGDSVSSLTGQLSNLTKDILTEGTEEVSDHATELSLAKEQIISLQSTQATQRIENERLKRIIREAEEKAEAAELQINSISRQYRAQLEEKEKEINSLKQRHHELLEHNAKEAALHPSGADATHPDAVSNAEFQSFQEGFEDWSNDSWGEFDDSLRLQREINTLRQEVSRLRADSQHWRSVAGQLSQQNGGEVAQSAQHDLLNLQAKVKELEKKAADSREQAQHEIASLQDVHQNKMATLKKRHKEEVTQFKSQVASLEQQLADARDGDSSGTGGSSSVLPESERAESEVEKTLRTQLAALTQERDKAQAAQSHMQGMLEELQREVESLQEQRDQLQDRVTTLDDSLHSQEQQFRQQVQSLQAQVEEAERWRMEAEQSRHQENQLKSSIAEAGTQLQQVSADTDALIEQLGDEESSQRTAAKVDSLERENLSLKEQCAKLQEQVTLLEKRAATQQEEWQKSQTTVKHLKRELNDLQGGVASNSDNTLDHSFTTGTDAGSNSTKSPPPKDETEPMDWEIQKEALEEVLAQLRQEVREKDEKISLLNTSAGGEGGELTSLQEENQRLQSELSAAQGERDELETSIGELDEQHQEATSHLIAARNTLQSQLSESQQQVKSLQEELQKANLQQNSPEPSSPSPDLSKQMEHLRQELETAQQEIHTLRQQADSREAELLELKQKLQKGTLALNDLHMDKKDLEEEVAKQQEETKAKVTAIKTLREEKVRLVEENKNLSERVEELEEELDSWEQRNEESQVERSKVQQLQDQLTAQQAENSSQQQKLDALFIELDEAKTLCRKLQQEGEGLDQDVGLAQSLVQERDRAVEEMNKAIQGRDTDAKKISDLKNQLEVLQEQDVSLQQLSSSQRIQELETQLSVLVQQLELHTNEKSALQEKVLKLGEEVSSQDVADIGDLKLYQQNIGRALQKRCTALNKLKQSLASHPEGFDQRGDSRTESADSAGECVIELCKENRSLLDTLVRGNGLLEEIQQQYYAGLSDSSSLLTPQSASNLQTSPSQGPDYSSSGTESDSQQAELKRLVEVIQDKDSEIVDLKQSLNHLQQEHSACRQSSDTLSDKLSELEMALSERDGELKMLHTENDQLMKMCEESKSRLAESDKKMASLKSQLQETEAVLQQTEADLNTSRQALEQMGEASAVHLRHKEELDSARHRIQQLENELSDAMDTLSSHKAGIEDLNAVCSDQRKTLEKEQAKLSQQEDVIAVLRQTSVTTDEELEVVKSQLNRAVAFLSKEQCDMIMGKASDSTDSSTSLPAIEYTSRSALDVRPTAHASGQQSGMLNGEVDAEDNSGQSELAERHAELMRQVEEKEEIIADLQQNNTTLLQMLEAKSLTSASGDSTQLQVHQLQSEVKALKVEKEQMLAVMNEKSREASSLKAEVMRLMNVVSAERSALDKLQKDNQELMTRSSPPRDDSLEDMTREAMHNLSRLVRDREVEIEALKQKNETLMAVIQDMDQSDGGAKGAGGAGSTGPSLASHLADKENLEKQLASLQAEREQMVAFVNQKHSESVAYHAEIQRLAALRAEEVQKYEKLQSDYDTLCPQFEDKQQTLLKTQNDLINYRQKYAELEVRYGELLQKSNASETVDAASFHELKDEKERIVSRQEDLQQEIQHREEKLSATLDKLKEMENVLTSKESEVMALKKQVDSLHFQLHSLRNETADLKQDKQAAEEKHTEWQEQGQALKDLNSQLTLSVREKEFEVASLQERVQKLTALVSEQQGEKTQVTQLLKEQEEASGLRAGLQQEVDQLTLALKQKQQQLNDIHAENLRLKEKEQKLSRELDRLRTHLLQIEEGYTREALEAEEREKELRNRLAHAEEQLSATASQVQSASHQASQQVESLQQQLHSLASQRDAAYMQVASLQDQSQQYASSLSNLQLVLEQFQREKDSLVASETERYQQESQKLKEQRAKLERELQQTKMELEEAADGLAAASRLSEQLDRKEEALQALREEVLHRETSLRTAEEEIHKLKSSKEAKVDRELMKNLLLGYFHTPDRNRMDAIHAIGSVLGFTQDDFHKIEDGEGGGWMSSLFRRTRSPGTPSTPVRAAASSQSFSQLFVKFLEVESTPPPAPVRLPAEEMAREAQQRHHVKERDSRDKPAFNPFTAPRHVAMPIAVGSAAAAVSSNSHLLMAPPPSSPTTTFPVFAPFSTPETSSSQSSSAILKDVLGSR